MNSKLKEITEILSNHGYNKSRNNDCSGDWYHGYYYKWNGFKEDFCEAIVIPNNEGFGESVIDCFLNDCDKPKEIDFINTRYEKVIFLKPSYNSLTEEEINKFLDEDETRQELYLNSI